MDDLLNASLSFEKNLFKNCIYMDDLKLPHHESDRL